MKRCEPGLIDIFTNPVIRNAICSFGFFCFWHFFQLVIASQKCQKEIIKAHDGSFTTAELSGSMEIHSGGRTTILS